MEAAKTTIDTFFTLKAYWPDYFADRNPNLPAIKLIMDVCLLTVLPNLTPEGYVIIFATLVDPDPSKFSFFPYIKLFDMMGTLWLAENGTAEGMLLVIDMNHTTLTHLSTFTLSGLKNLFCYLQEALPTRLKGMHYINTGVVMDKLMMLMKPFIKKGTFGNSNMKARLLDNVDYLVEQEGLVADETKRIGKRNHATQEYGLDGSFKKLDID